MAESIVTLRVDTRNAVSSLNNASLASKKLSSAAKGTTTSLHAASSAATGLGASLANALGPLIAVSSAVTLLGRSLSVFQSRERDAAILLKGLNNLGEGTNILKQLEKAADNLGNATLFSQDEFTRGFALLTSFRKIGVESYADVAEQAANIAQINQVDVSTSFMQLAKALQDPERNLSNLNRSGIAFSKQQTKVIKELMKTNQVAKAHTMILDIVKESYDEAALAASKGFAGSLDLLTEEFNDFSEKIGKALLPVLDQSVKALTAFLDFLNSEGGQAAAIIAGITLAVKGLSVALPLLKANLLGIAVSAQIATGNLIGTQATLKATSVGFATATAAANGFKIALAKTGIGLAIIAFGFLTTEILKTINAQKEYNRILEKGTVQETRIKIKELEEEFKNLETRIENFNPILDLLAEQFNGAIPTVSVLKVELKGLQKRLDALKESLKLKQELALAKEFRKAAKEIATTENELKSIIERSQIITEEGKKQFDLEKRRKELQQKFGEEIGNILLKREQSLIPLKKQVELIKKSEEAAAKLKEKFMEIGKGIEDGIVSNLTDAVMGTKTLAQAAISVLNDLKRSLIEVAIQRSIAGLGDRVGGFLGDVFKNLGKRANGGPVSAGGAFLVGEKGPELLQMGSRGGNIIPNNQLGGGTTNIVNVSVDASGSTVSGNTPDAQQLGNLIGAAIQERLIKEKRSGGLLSK